MSNVNEPSKGKVIATWVLSGLIALAMIGAGGSKLTGSEEQIKNFAMLGYPAWFLYVTGIIEVVGGILLLIPRTAVFGVLLLGATMVGAVVSLLRIGDVAHAPFPLMFLLVIALIGWLRIDSFRKLLGR
ncbi:MAG: DoxX family protein [Byssovorax sp.]